MQRLVIKANKKLLQQAKNIFGRDAVASAYVCQELYDEEEPGNKYIMWDMDYDIRNLKLGDNSIDYAEQIILIRFANGNDVIFTRDMCSTPKPKTEFTEC